MRGSPLSQQQAHAQRLELSPVPFEGLVLRRSGESAVARRRAGRIEADVAGLYDVFTASEVRGRGWARQLCRQLLVARGHGAPRRLSAGRRDQLGARSVYRRLGFNDAYAYHYRTPAQQSLNAR